MSPFSTSAVSGLPDPDQNAEFYADIPLKRFLAWLADTVVITLVCIVVLPFTAFTALFYFPVFYVVIGFIYRVLTISGRSATWGMRLVAIEFRNRSGERFDFGTALLHTLGYSVTIAFLIPQIASIVLMITGARRQGLTDLVLGSAAINKAARL